jgi:diguanylate cyclase (GGDEF)-like protein
MSQGEEYITKPKARMIAMIPAMVEVITMIFLFAFFPHLMIDENKEMTYVYYITFICIPVLYICVSGGRSLARAFRKENFAVRGQYLVCAIYPVIISIFGVLQTMWLNAPLFCFGCTIIMLYVYIISLNDQVSIDELTKLNNRTQLKKYIVSEHSRQGGDKVVRYVIMMDLNKFKYINDQFGHIEGDRALKRAADALKSACGSNPVRSFIARYGGDEFIVIAKTEDEDQVIALSRSIKEKIVQLNEEAGAKYELTASLGYASYSIAEISEFQAALAKADEELYKDKAKRKQTEKVAVT